MGNTEVEKKILWYFVWNFTEYFEWSDIEKSDFEQDKNKRIYELIEKYRWDTQLIQWEWLDLELSSYLSEISWFIPIWNEKQEFKYLRDMIKQNTAKRDMENTAKKILQWLRDWKDTTELMNIVWDFYGYEEEWESIEEIDKEILSDMTGVNTKNKYLTWYRELDKYLNGFIPWQFNIIAGRPSVWKSLIAVNFVINHIEKWAKCWLFSLEMSNKEVLQRAYAMLSWVPMNYIKDWADEESYNMIKSTIEWFNEVKKEQLFIYDNKLTLWQIVSEIRMLKRKKWVELFYIDYLWIIWVKEWENRNIDVSKITRTLKLLAKELKVVIVALAQLNRQSELWSKVPELSHLRDSWSIEQDADDIIMAARLKDVADDYDDYPEEEKKNILRFYVKKNRNWPVWFVDFKVNYAIMSLQDLPSNH